VSSQARKPLLFEGLFCIRRCLKLFVTGIDVIQEVRYYSIHRQRSTEKHKMNVQQVIADLETGALTEVPEAANQRYSPTRGLSIMQRFYIYPDDRLIAVDSCDGLSDAYELREGSDEYETFRHLYRCYFDGPTTAPTIH
jgi:hypothetical protein